MKRQSRRDDEPSGPFSFSYGDFDEWYQGLTVRRLRPAEQTFVRILNETLDQEFSDVGRLRVRVSHSRVKSAPRLWSKMLLDRYSGRIRKLDDIPEVIDDLVGVRITCNNLIDAIEIRKVIVSLESVDPKEHRAGICIDPDSERKHEKESGYRAYHINLHTLVGAARDWVSMRGELQVRTLLQDSWGELTHEDTYKPGGPMPDLVNKLSRRMADLLATVDDLAQDLRNELDQIAQRDLAGVSESRDSGLSAENGSLNESGRKEAADVADVRDALVAETRRVINGLSRPATLAQIAGQVQSSFGRQATRGWGGFTTFKELVRAADPSIHIVDTPPGICFPASLGFQALEEGLAPISDEVDGDVPDVIRRLKRRDSGLPAVSSARIARLLDLIVDVLDPVRWEENGIVEGRVGTQDINTLSKLMRDADSGVDGAIPRSNADYALKSLYFYDKLKPGLTRSDISDVLAESFFSRASRLGFVTDPEADRASIDAWFGRTNGRIAN